MAPFKRRVNRKEWKSNLNWSCQAYLRLYGQATMPALQIPSPPNLEQATGDEFSAVIGLYPLDPSAELSILHWGLMFERQPEWIVFPVHILAVHPGLKRDLTGLNLIEDKALLELEKSLLVHLLELVRAALDTQPNLAQQIRKDLVEAGLRGRLDGPCAVWNEVPLIRPGGWQRFYSLQELEAIYADRGYLCFDPSANTSVEVALLKSRYPLLLNYAPYVPLEELRDEAAWLLRVPTPHGEVRFSSRWPLPPPRILGGGKDVWPRMESGFLIARRPDAPPEHPAERRATMELLARVLLARLERNPDRFIGSAPALQLTLFLVPHNPILAQRFSLVRHPRERTTLAAALREEPLRYVLPGNTAQPLTPDAMVLVLSPDERDILAHVKQGWLLEVQCASSDMHNLADDPAQCFRTEATNTNESLSAKADLG